ncbi:hypothetical protein EDC04DRAFT_1054479 [Pisolithus marmoratus]|nr:hypothetical protein EDC04DRAFT_1054479 [Pisolithus marmoratus]
MSDVQGIVQGVAQRSSKTRKVLQLTDTRVMSACANSVRLVCDVLRSTPSLRESLRAVDDSLGILKWSVEIRSCSCGLPWFTENDYVIFVVGPAGAGQNWLAKQLFENRNIRVMKIREHVKALRFNHTNGQTNIVVISMTSFHTEHEDPGAQNTAIDWLKSSCFEKCHYGILFLHSLDSDLTDDINTLMTQRLETLAKALPSEFPVPSRVYVVPSTNSDPSETLNQRLSRLKTMLNGNENCQYHASLFPGIFKGQSETAWCAALLLLKDISETQVHPSSPLQYIWEITVCIGKWVHPPLA